MTESEALQTALSALKLARGFVEDELEHRRMSAIKQYICEAATTVQHLNDAIRTVEKSLVDINKNLSKDKP